MGDRTVLRFIFLIFALFGCSNIYVTEELAVKRFAALRIYGLSTLLSCFAYYCRNFSHLSEFFGNPTSQLNVIFFEFNFYWFVTVVGFGLTILNQPRVATWFERVLREIVTSGEYDLTTLNAVLVCKCLAVCVFLAGYSFTSPLTRNQPDLTVLGQLMYCFLNYVTSLIAFEFSTGVCLLSLLLEKSRRDLSRNLQRCSLGGGRIVVEYAELECAINVREVTSSYHDYYVLAVNLNECFAKHLFLITQLIFVELSYSLYYLFVKSDANLFVGLNVRVVYALFYFGFYLLQFLDYTVSCEWLNHENQKMLTLVNSAFAETKSERLLECMQVCLSQSEHLKLEMTACGFFSIDHSLIYKMVGWVTSTIVILFNFSNLPPGSGGTGNVTHPAAKLIAD